MKTIAPALAAHFQGDTLTTALCWTVEKKTGGTIRGTEHDQPITITTGPLAGDYLSISNVSGSDLKNQGNMAVDNMEVDTVNAENPEDGITWADIQAGAINNARVTVFVCNWRAPDDGQVVLRRGYIGDVTVDTDGNLKTEIRGLAQLLSQNIGRIMSDRCDVVRFGDSRCGYNVAAITGTGTISEITTNRAFQIDLTGAVTSWAHLPQGGEVEITSGANAGVMREVKTATVSAGVLTVELYDATPFDLALDDEVTFRPGCDRRFATCRYYNNGVNFRGYGLFVPGVLALMRGSIAGQTSTIPFEEIE